MPVTTRFNRALADWYRRNVDRLDPLWAVPEFDTETVRVALRRFVSALSLTLSRHGANVVVEWESEGWDLLYADDVIPEKLCDGRWFCRWCPQPLREFATVEALWADHLFEPLARWCENVLVPATALHLHRHSHCTWATLGSRTDPAPLSAAFTIYALAEEEAE